jgi:hypothetical protein
LALDGGRPQELGAANGRAAASTNQSTLEAVRVQQVPWRYNVAMEKKKDKKIEVRSE